MKGKRNLKELLNRLIEWLKNHDISADEILDCLTFITGK